MHRPQVVQPWNAQPMRFALLAGGLLLLLAGMLGGLLRMGWAWPVPMPRVIVDHGAIMIGGFLGALLTLERAVAIGKGWCYIGPLASAAGGITLAAGGPARLGAGLIVLASAIMAADFVVIIRRQLAAFTITMALGAATWFVGNVLWLCGQPVYNLVFWWMAFPVLTIVGERLELSRLMPPTRLRRSSFVIAVCMLLAGLLTTLPAPAVGGAVVGISMMLLAAWLAIYDVARHTIRGRGLARFVAACLLPGYFWLAAGGFMACWWLWLAPALHGGGWAGAPLYAGFHYDAVLHAIFLGFVFSMIFGHAPIIFPAVLKLRMRFSLRFYVPLLLLQVSVAWRVAADVAMSSPQRRWAALLNVLAIMFFLVNTVSSIQRPVAAGKHKEIIL